MPLSIKVSETSTNTTQEVTLGAVVYTLEMRFNPSDEAWYLDLSTLNGESLRRNVKVMPNQNLTGRYKYLTPIPEGDIWCFRVRNDFSPVGEFNFGIGKTYELVYLTEEEMQAGGINDTIQL